jgi:hypothetical protein
MLQVLAPAVQHRDGADLGAEVTRIGSDRAQRFGCRPKQDAVDVALFWNAIAATWAGTVKTTWKYGTGSSSACRSGSHSARASPWHFGQCQLRQEL